MTDPAPVPAPAPAPEPPPSAPGFGELFEQSLTAVVSPGVFRLAAARPAPSFAAAGGLGLAAGAASLAVNLAHAAVESPSLLTRFPPAFVAVIGAAALGLYASALLLLSVMLFGLGHALGGKGGFDRALQAAAMMSVLWPVQMLCSWFAYAWVLPVALAAWVAACALEGLFGANRVSTRAACAVLAAGALGLQMIGRVVADRARQAYAATQAVTQAASAGADLAQRMEAMQRQAEAASGTAAGAPAATAASGLDLLRGPSDYGAAPQAAGATQADMMLQSAKGIQASAAGMLDAMAPMMSNLANGKNMTPQQKSDMKELQAMMGDLRTQMASGRRVSDAEFAPKLAKIQQLAVRMMSAAALAPPSTAAPPPQSPASPPGGAR
jgi:hypothetical protein